MSNRQQALQAYRNVEKQAEKQEDDPVKVIAILLTNTIEAINIAKITMAQNKIEDKGRYISLAITLIDGLKASLDLGAGGDIAYNLSDLYDYMMTRLVQANLENNQDILNEVTELLKNIKEGWDGVQEFAQDKKKSQNEK